MGMFEYTPQQTQVQISDIPQVKTTSKAAEAFDAISTMVKTVGTAYYNAEQIDYQTAKAEEKLKKETAAEAEKIKKEENSKLISGYSVQLAIDKDNLQKSFGTNAYPKIKQKFVTDWDINKFKNITDDPVANDNFIKQILVQDNEFVKLEREERKKNEQNTASNFLNSINSLQLITVDNYSTYLAYRPGDDANATTDFIKDVGNKIKLNAQTEFRKKPDGSIDNVNSYYGLKAVKDGFVSQMGTLNLKDHFETDKVVIQFDTLLKELANAAKSELNQALEGRDVNLVMKKANEVASLGYFPIDLLNDDIKKFSYKLKDTKDHTKEQLNAFAVLNPLQVPFDTPDLTGKTKNVMENAIIEKFYKNDVTAVLGAVSINKGEVSGILNKEVTRQIQSIGNSKSNEEAAQKIQQLKGMVLQYSSSAGLISNENYEALNVAETLIKTNDVKNYYTAYTTYYTNKNTGVTIQPLNKKDPVFRAIEKAADGDPIVLNEINKQVNAFQMLGQPVDVAMIEKISIPYKRVKVGDNKIAPSVLKAMGASGDADTLEIYVDTFVDTLVKNKQWNKESADKFKKGGYILTEVPGNLIQATHKDGSTFFIPKAVFKVEKKQIVEKIVKEKQKTFTSNFVKGASKSTNAVYQGYQDVVVKPLGFDKLGKKIEETGANIWKFLKGD